MIKCSECGFENMDGLDYCDGCGAKLAPAHGAAMGAATADHLEPEHETASIVQGAAAGESLARASEDAPGEQTHEHLAGAEHVAPTEVTHEVPLHEVRPIEPSHTNDAPAQPAANLEPVAPDVSRAPTGEMQVPATPPGQGMPVVSNVPFKAKLSILRGTVPERRGHEFELEPGNNLIGRWDPETGSFPEVDLDADDPEAKISRKHALIRIDGGRITLEDIGSLNGTYVNRQPRLQPGNPVDLKDGDEIIIGKTFMKLTVSPIS